ncbi:MAG: multiheme c-type cytochrome, partial [Armatimonadota bacterium]
AMKYDGAVPGEMDLLEGEAVFRRRWCGLGFAVAANLLDAEGKYFLSQYLVRQVTIRGARRPRQVKVAVTGVVSPLLISKLAELSSRSLDWVRAEDPTAVLKSLVPKLRKEATVVVVLAHTGIPAAAQLAKDVPGIDVVVAGHNPAVSVLSPPNLGGPLLVAAGDRGRHITELRLKLTDEGEVEAYSTSQMALGDVIPDDPQVGELMETYRRQAAEYGRRARAALAAKRTDQAGPYVGAKVCAMCHASASAQWKTTKHADAINSLKKWHPSAAERIECLQCHVLGLGDPHGYLSEQDTPDLAGVQCEHCHGAGRKHVEAAWLNKPSSDLIVKSPNEALCRRCHDDEHHPKFDYAASIVKVRHR